MHPPMQPGRSSNAMSAKPISQAETAGDGLTQTPSESASPARHRRGRRNDALALLLVRHEMRGLRRRFEEFERDILLPILLGEIALHNIGALEHGHGEAGASRRRRALRPCNTYSIAAATDLPRETVRRKVNRLIERGWIERKDNGHLFVTAAAMKRFGQLLIERELLEILELAEAVRKHLDS